MEREELYFQPEIECAEPEVLREIQSERLRSMVAQVLSTRSILSP